MSEKVENIDYRQVMEYSLDPLIIHTELKIIDVNSVAVDFFRAPREELIGVSPLDIFQETSKSSIFDRIQSAYEKPAKVIEETIYRMDGKTVDVELYCHPVRLGDTLAIQTYVKDITERKLNEKKHLETINQVNELSSSIVPLLDGIAILPLIGSFDEDRARQLLENIPLKVKKQGVNHLIIDFSGIYTLDYIVTEYLFKIYSVLSLLGVQSIFTGLRPELALIALQIDTRLSSIPTKSKVKEALISLGIDVTSSN
ncbi:PAS domain S-box protein [Bacillus sp. NTK071]|uniref:PAS domain S-box protein n=1 Tax=Bacillus sp. NTK071 TaxID=2802175 RepID=UPI001A9054E4|nr:PAS domain S-box protein [Bacillus sp. NTK071]MBN8207538.1 PAS domain S-box protein [Bacillus sp. NTK071]